MPDIEKRVYALEEWRNKKNTEDAVLKVRLDEHEKHMDDRFDRVEKNQNEMRGAVWKIIWTVAAIFITAAMTFIFKGGLNGQGI